MSDNLARRATYARYNVTACYPDMEAAKAGVEALEEAGVPGSDLSLLGDAAEEAATVGDTADRDERTLRAGMRATLGGAVIGTVVGALVGLVVGLLAFGGFDPAWGVLAFVIGAGVAGGGVGFTAGAMARMKQSQAWELTLDDVERGSVVVGVHTETEAVYDQAVEVIGRTNPEQVRRFAADGSELGESG